MAEIVNTNVRPVQSVRQRSTAIRIRTILVALDLLRGDGVDRRHAVRMAPIIHASDTATAYFVMQSGLVPRDTGRLIVTISAINTLLSLLMQKRSKD